MRTKSTNYTIAGAVAPTLLLACIISLSISCSKTSGSSTTGSDKTLMFQPAGASAHNVSVYDFVPYNPGPPETTYVNPVPTKNFNGDTIVSVNNYGFENFNAANVLLRFQGLASLPGTATVTSAKLYLYGIDSIVTNIRSSGPIAAGQFGNTLNAAGAHPFVLQQLAEGWSDNSVTWNNMPAALPGVITTFPPSATRWNNNDTLDVTSLVKIWQANPAQNYGCRLAVSFGAGSAVPQPFSGSFQQMQFYSSYAANAAVRPKLVVTYRE